MIAYNINRNRYNIIYSINIGMLYKLLYEHVDIKIYVILGQKLFLTIFNSKKNQLSLVKMDFHTSTKR